jgi:DNA-directed RNA polymerase specialized sigma24 family protein
MSSADSVTHWLRQLQAGERGAAQKLWERYYLRLVGLARKRLQGLPRRAADEEDVALSAFDSFCRGAEGGLFPRLDDRDNLWRLLVVITARKAFHLIRSETRPRRGGRGETQAQGAPGHVTEIDLETIVGNEPTPEFAAMVADECQRLFAVLGDPELEAIARWKMEGYTANEIARKLDYVPRTIERKLQLIRDIWSKTHE